MSKTAIFDIDGTISLMSTRLEYITGDKKNYKEFYDRVNEDTVNTPIREILWALRKNGWNVIFVTGRSESARVKTLEWLSNNLMHAETEDLLMRKENDYRKDFVVKAELCRPFIDEVSLVFEDRTQVCAMWRRLGKTCLQVAEGNY